MDDTQINTLAQIRKILATSAGLVFKGLRREAIYTWIASVLKRFNYFRLGKKDIIATVEIIFLRHAPAGDREDWALTGRPGFERPLTAGGRKRASSGRPRGYRL